MPQSHPPALAPGYLLPEDAHQRLQLARDHLQLLASLAEPRTRHEDDHGGPPIPLGVWSVCLAHLCEQMTQALAEAHWQRSA